MFVWLCYSIYFKLLLHINCISDGYVIKYIVLWIYENVIVIGYMKM